MRKMEGYTWDQAFGPCFLEVRAPCLTELNVLLEEEGHVFSWDVLETIPAVRRIHIDSQINRPLGGAVLQAISAALHHGALGSLKSLILWDCTVGDRDVSDFMDALEKSGCAKRMVNLLFDQCEVGVAGVQSLANLLCRDAFPALKALFFDRDPGVTDVGVVALGEALLKAKGTFLEDLDLVRVGMSDEGIAAIANLVSQGRLKQLNGVLDLSENEDVTNEGIVALARSIDAHGLPLLTTFKLTGLDTDKVTLFGISAIALAVIKGCPKLTHVCLTCAGPDDVYYEIVMGMLAAAGRAGEVKVGGAAPVIEAGNDDDEEEGDDVA